MIRAPLPGRRWRARLAPGCLLLVALGCSTPPTGGLIPGTGDALPPVDEPYRIQAGDELEIRFFHTPELNVLLPVRPDGHISLPLAHEVAAAGRTVEELRSELVERCSRQLARPEIAVIVRAFATYLVHVGGEVTRPGVLRLDGPRTVLDAILECGGFLPTARLTDAMVVRRVEQGQFELVIADLAGVLGGADARGNVLLRPFDVVYVPRSRIADVNQWVEQYIRLNIPITFSYRLGVD